MYVLHNFSLTVTASLVRVSDVLFVVSIYFVVPYIIKLFACWEVYHDFLSSADFFKINIFKSQYCRSVEQFVPRSGPEVIKLFSYSTHLSTKFILLINVKMPTIVGILTFVSMINATSERL